MKEDFKIAANIVHYDAACGMGGDYQG